MAPGRHQDSVRLKALLLAGSANSDDATLAILVDPLDLGIEPDIDPGIRAGALASPAFCLLMTLIMPASPAS